MGVTAVLAGTRLGLGRNSGGGGEAEEVPGHRDTQAAPGAWHNQQALIKL